MLYKLVAKLRNVRILFIYIFIVLDYRDDSLKILYLVALAIVVPKLHNYINLKKIKPSNY